MGSTIPVYYSPKHKKIYSSNRSVPNDMANEWMEVLILFTFVLMIVCDVRSPVKVGFRRDPCDDLMEGGGGIGGDLGRLFSCYLSKRTTP